MLGTTQMNDKKKLKTCLFGKLFDTNKSIK